MAFGLTHCGGSSGTPRDAAGSGGSTGAGGTSVTGSGGSGGSGSGGSGGGVGGSSGGATGSGGAGGTNPSLSCTPGVSPAMPIITDFSPTSWSTTTGKWGVVGNLTGAPFAYKGPMAGTAMASSVATEIMTLTGTVAAGDYAGGGLSFDQCVNTTTYTGVQFTLGGSTGGCDVLLQVQTYSQQGVSNRGGCATGASCYHFPQLKVQVGSPVTVHFTDVANTGMPVAAADIAKEIVGLQFQLQVPPGAPDGGTQSPCNGVAVTIDDVRFVSN